ncbi:MAG: hypothetical protein ACRD0K_27360 [Egibacteraceae bacterium]
MIDRVNRAVLLLLGLSLCAAGGVVIAAQQRALRLLPPSALYESLRSSIAGRPALWWTVIIAAAVLLAVLGLIYAFRQLVVGGHRLDAVLLGRSDRGVTRLEPSAVSRALAADLRSMDDVMGSRVRLRTLLPQPSLAVRLDVDEDADVGQVRAHAVEAFQRLSRTLGVDGLDVDLQLRLRSDIAPPTRVE